MYEQTMTESRNMTLPEVGHLVKILREAHGWTQETLAEISGVTARTIQRVGNGDSASVDTRRALARAFELQDIDTFNKPHDFKSEEDFKKEVEDFKRTNLVLDVSIARKGVDLALLAEICDIWSFDQQGGFGINDDIDETVAELFDYLLEYGDCVDLYSYSQKRGVHNDLGSLIKRLKAVGYSVCFARRDTKLMNERWKDQRAWSVSIGYVFLALMGKEPKNVVVPKAIKF
ncbi:helix-turn-helix domain-containing protein [Rhodospirillum sp. A1_3_36]|uniref:helix-turn-helix domain-containing protein n=1 Tax=Rhodospirillum sp. A1_3_36 TaxID=3391666 RepID=UPI0039A6262E